MAHTLKVGNILSSSWGYDQTNVTFYQVTRTTALSVELRTLQSNATYDNTTMTGTKMPIAGKFAHGNKFVKRVSAYGQVKIGYSEYASLWNGKPQRYSSYA